jgi:NAD-dependent SIR2 family protein deacetylase
MPFFDVLCNKCGDKTEEWTFLSKIEREGHTPCSKCKSTDRQIVPTTFAVNSKTTSKSSFRDDIVQGIKTGRLQREVSQDYFKGTEHEE